MKDKRSINLLNPDHHEKPSLFPTYARGLSLISAVTLTTLYIVYSASGANTTIGNNISTSGTLTVGSTGRFSGAFYASSTLQASGEARFYNNAIVDGNVGIGTTTPSSTLSVQGNALFSGNISSVANITATGTLSLTGTSGTSTIASGQGFTVGDSQFIVQQGSGRVGIGTSSPTQLLTLGEETSRIGTDSADGSDNKRLQISGANASATRGAYISLHGNEYSTDPGDLGIFAGSNAVGKIIFHTGGTEQVRINSSGNVGIGTTSPAQTLAVQGNALFSGNLSVANVTATGSIAFINTSTSTVPNGVLNAWTLATSTSATPIISLNTNQSGNSISRVAINGNRADASLHVYGTGVSGNTNRLAQFQQTQNNTGATIIISGLDSNGNNNWWNFGPGPTTTAFIIGNSHDPNINERFRIDGSGNVGIGTTSPAQTLAVQGNALFSGNLSVANITATGTLTVSGTASSSIATALG